MLLSLNRCSLSEQLCQCKTIAFLPSLVLPVPPQGHRVDESAEHSCAFCETSQLWQRLGFCLKLLKEVTGPHQQLEGWGGEFQVAGNGSGGITARHRKCLSTMSLGFRGNIPVWGGLAVWKKVLVVQVDTWPKSKGVSRRLSQEQHTQRKSPSGFLC